MDQNPLLIILGPTASGKTKIAVRLAAALSAEIISADSRQVFKNMDIGTGKDLAEYHVKGKDIPHYLINIREAGERYNVHEFKEDFYHIFESLSSRKILPILCGGTGMYIHSILQEHEYTAIPVDQAFRDTLKIEDISSLRTMLDSYPTALTAHADRSSAKRLVRALEIARYLSQHELKPVERPLIRPLIIGLSSDVQLRRERIIRRLEERLEQGMIEEVRSLLDEGVSPEMLSFYGLEYKWVTAYLQHEISYDTLKERLVVAICQFAKRQMTFFRKMEKDGVEINWFDSAQEAGNLYENILSFCKNRGI